jgi:hypothetical protein
MKKTNRQSQNTISALTYNFFTLVVNSLQAQPGDKIRQKQ